jgi:hypothetical protein
LAGLYLFEGSYAEALKLLGLGALGTGDRTRDSPTIALMIGDEWARTTALEKLRGVPEGEIERTVYMLGASGHLLAAAQVSALLLDSVSRRGTEGRALGLLLSSYLEVARGRVRRHPPGRRPRSR